MCVMVICVMASFNSMWPRGSSSIYESECASHHRNKLSKEEGLGARSDRRVLSPAHRSGGSVRYKNEAPHYSFYKLHQKCELHEAFQTLQKTLQKTNLSEIRPLSTAITRPPPQS